MNEIIQLIESIADNNLKSVLSRGYKTVFEANYYNGKAPTVGSAQMMGGFNQIMKQVGLGVVGGNGMQIDKSIDHHVNTSAASTRDLKEETQTQWASPKMGTPPLKSRAPAFVDKAIQASKDHMPNATPVGIPSSQRRFSMIYPTLNNGVNLASPKITT